MDNLGYPRPPWRPEDFASGDEHDRQERIALMRSVAPKRSKNPKVWPKILAIVLVFVVLVVGLSWIFTVSTSTKTKVPHRVVAHTKVAVKTAAPKIQTQSYTSTDFSLSLNYPDGWKLIDNGNGPMTITSPSMVLASDTGQKVTGLITVTIMSQGDLPASFSAGTALAVLDSQLITYTQPTSSQPAQAYLSFVQYSSTNTVGGLNAIYLSGNYGYQKDQVIPASDISSISPLVVVSFTKCANDQCNSNLTPLTIASTSWTSDAALESPIMTILTSLAFQ